MAVVDPVQQRWHESVVGLSQLPRQPSSSCWDWISIQSNNSEHKGTPSFSLDTECYRNFVDFVDYMNFVDNMAH
jgi:hypothetical protein